MFKVEGSNLAIQIYRQDSLGRRHYIFECSIECALLRGSLCGYGQVKHRKGNVQWIYSILLDVSESLAILPLTGREECKV